MLEVQLLEAGAKAPVVAHAGEDLGYDLFALEDTVLPHGQVVAVRTGIAVAAYRLHMKKEPLGLLIRDRSSMAMKGIVTSGGVIDAGYRGEIKVLMTDWNKEHDGDPFGGYVIGAGDKIAQMIPVAVLTGEVYVVGELEKAVRGAAGFGSTGK